MCKETTAVRETKRVVVVGAGPAGLLASIFLLRRNQKESSTTDYHVTLVDPGLDYGKLDEEGLKRKRSWMIGLSDHGLTAVKEVPELYDNYVSNLGVHMQHATLGIGSMKFDLSMEEMKNSFLVDRNYICAGLARYLNEKHGSDGKGRFVAKYHTRGMFVDAENQCLMVRTKDKDGEGESHDSTIPYDILLGCDGIRSVVRNAFMAAHRDFEMDIAGLFNSGRSLHIPTPKAVKEGQFLLLVNAIPNGTVFGLPETNGMINFTMGCSLTAPLEEEMYSEDTKVVADYMRRKFKLFEMDFDEFAEHWVKTETTTSQQVHCNFYHSSRLHALILGDAAHATSPQIGQGMNTALADASALNQLLDKFNDNWDVVLPEFSKERVKEGNALTDLSFHTYSVDAGMQARLIVSQLFRRVRHQLFPWFFENDPMSEIPKGMKLSVAYDKMVKVGGLRKVRERNRAIIQEHFEKNSGMVVEDKPSMLGYFTKAGFVAGLAYAAVVAQRHFNP